MLKLSVGIATVALAFMAGGQAMAASSDDIDDFRSTGRSANEWRLIRNDRIHAIKSYDKLDEGKSLRNFRVESDVDADFNTIAKVYFDFANYPKWFHKCQQAKLLRKVSSTEFYYYIVYDAPPGLPDRDAILHGKIERYTPQRGYAKLTLTADPNYLPLKPPLVRMEAQNMTFVWTPTGSSQTHGVAEGYIDPGGVMPSWAINYVQRQAPFNSALGLLRMIIRAPYNDPKVAPEFPLSD